MSTIYLGLHTHPLLVVYGYGEVMGLRSTTSVLGVLAFVEIGVCGVTTEMSSSFFVWWWGAPFCVWSCVSTEILPSLFEVMTISSKGIVFLWFNYEGAIINVPPNMSRFPEFAILLETGIFSFL